MKIYKIILLMVLVIVSFNYSYSQVDSPDVIPNTDPNYKDGEVHISVSKVYPGNLVLSAMTKYINNTIPTQISRFLSKDFGQTWTGTPYFKTSSNYGDPTTAFDAKGNAYIATLNGCASGINFQKCSNANQGSSSIWSLEKAAIDDGCGIKHHDKEMMACDNMPQSPFANNVYFAWWDFTSNRINFNRSIDESNTFSNTIVLGTLGGSGTNVQTGPNGEVYVVWGDNYRIGFASSLNGGNSFSYQTDNAFPINGIQGIYFNGQGCLSFPYMAVDKSCRPTSYRGRIYISCDEKTSIDPAPFKSEIIVRYSDDKGITWPLANKKTVSIPSALNCYHHCIAVDDATGDVSVIYYAIEDAAFTTNAYVAYSSDGGATFNNIKVSDASFITAGGIVPGGHYIGITAYGGISYPAWFDTNVKKVKVSPVKFPTAQYYQSSANLNINGTLTSSAIASSVNYQAYYSIVTPLVGSMNVPSGAKAYFKAGNLISFKPGFTVDVGGNLDASIQTGTPCMSTVNRVGDISFIPSSDSAYTEALVYPNPFFRNISIKYEFKERSAVDIQLYDTKGMLVKSVKAEEQEIGVKELTFDFSSIPNGNYEYILNLGGITKRGKLIKSNFEGEMNMRIEEEEERREGKEK